MCCMSEKGNLVEEIEIGDVNGREPRNMEVLPNVDFEIMYQRGWVIL